MLAAVARSRPIAVLVVGGGIAGMAFAITAARLGLCVEIVEIDPEWKVSGAGISIIGPTFRALKRLGILDEVISGGLFIREGGRICGPDGAIVAEIPMQSLASDLPVSGGILRPRLHEILARHVREAGVEVRLGVGLTEFENESDLVRAHTTDGEVRDYDAVVVADGARSVTRAKLFPSAPAMEYTGQYCWRTLAARPAEVDRPYFFMGGEIFAGLMPVSDDLMYLWLLEGVAERRRIDDERLPDALRALLAPFGGPLAAVRDQLSNKSQINSRPLDATLLSPPWHRGRCILIGDAAHAPTPHLASGAGIAIEDGLLLAEMLAEGEDVAGTFAAFTARRWERCRLVVEDSVGIGRMQQTKASPEELNARMRRAQAVLNDDI